MPTPLNEQVLLERVAAETRLENEAPLASSVNSNPGRRRQGTEVRANPSGVANEGSGYFGTGPGTT